MKKIIALCSAICISMNIGAAFAAEDVYLKSDAEVTVEGQNDAFSGEEVVLIVLNQSNGETEWEDIRSASDFSAVTFYDTLKCNEKGEYSFSFEPGNSGVYKCIVSGGEDEFMLYYTDEDALAAAVDAIEDINLSEKETALEEIKECIETYHLDFGIYGELYSAVDISDVAELVFEYLNGKGKGKDISIAVKHGFIAALANEESIEDIEEYLYALSLKDMKLEKFWQRGDDVTDYINENAPYSSIDEFTTMLAETLTGITIEYSNGTDNIKEIIKLCSDMSGVDEDKITDDLCKSVAGKDDFYDFKALADYVDSYKPSSQNKGGSSGGGGRSSAVSAMSGVTIAPTEEDNQQEVQSVGMFSDVSENHWAKEMIEELCVKGVVAGKGGGVFCPGDNITREEFVKLLVSAMNLNTIGKELAFDDVSQDDWFYKYVYTAYNSKIVKGISENMFGSGQPITRQDLAVMAYNTINVCDLKTSGKADNDFVDWNEVADYAGDAVAALKADGILSGDEDGSFRPNDNTTRAEAVKIIYMLMALK